MRSDVHCDDAEKTNPHVPMTEKKCGATCSDGSECQKYPVQGRNRCSHHGGDTPRKDENPNVGNGDQKGNQNAQTHALFAERDGYYQDLSEKEQNWVFDFTNDLLDRKRRMIGGDPDMFDKEALKNIAIDFHRVATANSWFSEKGITQPERKVTPQGGTVVTGKKLNTWASEIRQYNESIYRRMKKHGLLEDPDSKQAEEVGNLISQLKNPDSSQ